MRFLRLIGSAFIVAAATVSVVMTSGCPEPTKDTNDKPKGGGGSGGGGSSTSSTSFTSSTSAQPEGTFDIYRTGNRLVSAGSDYYLDNIQTVFAKRCMVCHSCSESPCQLKLDSYIGVRRGLTELNPYAYNLTPSEPTFWEDQYSASEWRNHGFSSVLEKDTADASPMMLAALQAGRTNVPGAFPRFTDKTTYQDWTCPATSTDYNGFIKDHPDWGMPFGLPLIPEAEYNLLASWLKNGAPGPSAEMAQKITEPTVPEVINRWENFLLLGAGEGAPAPHIDLVSRFIYEHVFLSHLHFDENPGEFFRLVRSRTPPGQPVDEIYTALPYDDPKVDGPVYYRLKKIAAVIARKNHIIWNLNDKRLQFYQDLFYGNQHWWSADTKNPGYATWNPFRNFEQIPARIRYQWMLDNTRLIAEHMARGPVCVGSQATYVVGDHFWGWFLDPDSDPSVVDPQFGQDNWDLLGMKDPAHVTQYLQNKEAALQKLLAAKGQRGLGVNNIWDGRNGSPWPNPNAWDTLLRHQTNMSVFNGTRGGWPQTIWVVNFTNLERLFYDLVASFDAYDSMKNKLAIWYYMTGVRQEAEDFFVTFLPADQRQAVHDEWASEHALADIPAMLAMDRPPATDGPLTPEQLALNVMHHLGSDVVEQHSDGLNNWPESDAATTPTPITDQASWEAGFATLGGHSYRNTQQFFPNVTYVHVGGPDSDLMYTIVADREYNTHNMVFTEALERRPERDTLSLYRGLMGNYPVFFVDIPFEKAATALGQLRAVNSDASWDAFTATYGVPRTSERFWPMVEWLNAWQVRHEPIDAGILDMTLYDRKSQ